jgi:hypothetical protein
LMIGGGMLAVGVVGWAFWGNPESAPRIHPSQEVKAALELKLVSERSPYNADRTLTRHAAGMPQY